MSPRTETRYALRITVHDVLSARHAELGLNRRCRAVGKLELSRVIEDRPLALSSSYLARGCTVLDGDATERRSREPLLDNLSFRHIPFISLFLLPYHPQQAAIQLRPSPRTLISSRNGRPPSIVDEDTHNPVSPPSSSKHSTPRCQNASIRGRQQDRRAQTTRHHLTPPGRYSKLAYRDPYLPRASVPAH